MHGEGSKFYNPYIREKKAGTTEYYLPQEGCVIMNIA